MKHTPLTAVAFQLSCSDRCAIVDHEDYPMVSKHTWGLYKGKRYPSAHIDGKNVDLHNFITGTVWIDHKNQITTDCRRSNLRPATNSQNQQNRRKLTSNPTTSIYKGVSWRPSPYQCWRAMIKCGPKLIFVGHFPTEEEAARAYDAKARKLFGEFARLNFPNLGEQPALEAA